MIAARGKYFISRRVVRVTSAISWREYRSLQTSLRETPDKSPELPDPRYYARRSRRDRIVPYFDPTCPPQQEREECNIGKCAILGDFYYAIGSRMRIAIN